MTLNLSSEYHIVSQTAQIKMEESPFSTIRIADSPTKKKGSSMCFHNIEYNVQIQERICGGCRKTREKKVLCSVSGILEPGLNAIMGQTGSGKTSLLDVLANRKDPKWISGNVLLDGKLLPKNFQYISGYVTQNDLLMATVTVREALWFCANMRLPTKVLYSEKQKRIENILSVLGLHSCADTKIGSDIYRGISGGERKRTSIALEMILQPQILFLDEPTSGLDAATANSVMRLLKKLGSEGNTIVCSIHQPRYGIFALFDSLTLLSMGNVIYHGPRTDAIGYFQNMGYVCKEHDNPADFFLDVLNGEYDSSTSCSMTICSDNAEDQKTLEEAELVSYDAIRLSNKFSEAYMQSEKYRSITSELSSVTDNLLGVVQTQSGQMYATSTMHQLRILLHRTFMNIVRNPAALIGNIVMNVIIGIVFGLLYYQVDHSPDKGIQNRLGILFFICTSLLFGSISVINTFTAERELFIHENVSGYYRVVSYFLSKVLADLIPLRTIAPIIFCSITYWMVGLKSAPCAFFIFLLTCIFIGYASVGIGIFYSASLQQAVAQICLVLTFVFTIIFSGLLVNVEAMLPWLSWLKYLSVARYGLVGLSINELREQVFTSCGNASTMARSFSIFASNFNLTILTNDMNVTCVSVKGEEFLHRSLSVGQNAVSINGWALWQNHVALGSLIIGLYTLTYIQLIRIRKFS